MQKRNQKNSVEKEKLKILCRLLQDADKIHSLALENMQAGANNTPFYELENYSRMRDTAFCQLMLGGYNYTLISVNNNDYSMDKMMLKIGETPYYCSVKRVKEILRKDMELVLPSAKFSQYYTHEELLQYEIKQKNSMITTSMLLITSKHTSKPFRQGISASVG